MGSYRSALSCVIGDATLFPVIGDATLFPKRRYVVRYRGRYPFSGVIGDATLFPKRRYVVGYRGRYPFSEEALRCECGEF